MCDTDETQARKQIRKEVLNKRFNELPHSNLIQVLDENPETVVELALRHGFSKAMVDDMTDKQFGGGEPHARFIDLVQSKNFSIEEVKGAMLRAGINEDRVHEHFSVAEEKQYNYFEELRPSEINPIYKLVREDIYNRNKPSWRHVAEELGMNDVIPIISNMRAQGGMYSIGNAFCKLIIAEDLTIRKFKEVLENEIDRRREDGESATAIEKILDMYGKAIEHKVDIMIRVDKQRKEREDRMAER